MPKDLFNSRELIREKILRMLESIRPLGFKLLSIHQGLRAAGLLPRAEDGAEEREQRRQLTAELEAMEEQGLLKSKGAELDGAVLVYRLTEAGRVALERVKAEH